jgi:hypothetical protein
MKLRLGLTGLIMLAVAGCGLISRPAGSGPGDCPSPAADTQLLKDEEHGYCLLYPKDYRTEQPNPDETVLFTGSLQNVEAGRAYIQVSDAGGRAASEIAGGIVAEVKASLPDWGVRQSATKIGGETAIVLDNVPGQDISRQVVTVHNGRLYLLTFVPADPSQADAYQAMDKLYTTALESFRFTP